MPGRFYSRNDQDLTVTGLADQTGTILVGATVTATLVDCNNAPVAGLTALSLTDVSGTPGSYTVKIDGTQFNPAVACYTLQITAVVNGLHLYVERAVKVAKRTI